MSVGIIILAAGASSRMGRPKLQLNVFDKSLLTLITHEALDSKADRVVVVTGAHHYEMSSLPTIKGFGIIHNDDWEAGIGSSIKIGLKSLMASSQNVDAAIFLVADQPYVTSKHIDKLISSFADSGKIVASFYNGTSGVPVLFPGRFFADILNIEDHNGAKPLLQRNEHDVTLVNFPEGAIDLDTPEDYQNFLKSLKK